MLSSKAIGRPFQVGIVVKNLNNAVKKYWNTFGIGPWAIYDFEIGSVKDPFVMGIAQEYGMKIALTMFGQFQIELIQPLDKNSIYFDHLERKGEGLHHYCCSVENMEDSIKELLKSGIKIIQSGTLWKSGKFAYLDTENDLGYVLEISQRAKQEDRVKPTEMYPVR